MAELLIAFGIITTIIWIIIGWRAMRAHEQIASQVTLHFRTLLSNDSHNYRKENAAQHKYYRLFILQNPEVEKMPPKERHELFRYWLESRGDEPAD